MSKLTVTIPDDLHQKIREELERQFIEFCYQSSHNQQKLSAWEPPPSKV